MQVNREWDRLQDESKDDQDKPVMNSDDKLDSVSEVSAD